MKKIVINRCYGGYGLSLEAVKRYCEIKNIPLFIDQDEKYKRLGIYTFWIVPKDQWMDKDVDWHAMNMDERHSFNSEWDKRTFEPGKIKRDDEILVKVVAELGKRANGNHAELKVVEIPNDVEWEIDEYDGLETIDEVHRSWN